MSQALETAGPAMHRKIESEAAGATARTSPAGAPRGTPGATHPVPPTAMRRATRCWLVLSFHAAVLAVLAIPLLSVAVPPLTDYPNHLARMHILADYDTSAALRENYVVAWKAAPYLAMDLIVPPLAHVLSIYAAGKVFLFLCLALFVAGTTAVHAALHRRLSAWPAVSALLVYGFVFSYGLVPYMFGAAVWLLAFAGWIALSRRPAAARIAGGAVLGLAVYFCHFFAFFGYALTVAAFELGTWWPRRREGVSSLARRGLTAFCALLPAFLLFAHASTGQQGGATVWASPHGWIVAMASPFLFPGVKAHFAILALFLILPVRAGLLGRPSLAPAMRVPLALVGAATLAMPNVILGVWGVDYRLPIVLAALAIASCDWRDVPVRAVVPLGAGLLGLLAVDCGLIAWTWQPIGRQFDQFRAAIRAIPQGARVLAWRDTDGLDPALSLEPAARYDHLPALAVIERDAYLPFLFKPPMFPVEARLSLRAIDTPVGKPISLADLTEGADPVRGAASLGSSATMGERNWWGGWPANFDVAVELSFGARPALPPHLSPLASGTFFAIYRIEK